MTCEELRDHLELYALGVFEPPEAEEVREHLSKAGDPCVASIQLARSLLATMAVAAPPLADPPAGLRKKVLALVRPETKAWTWLFAAASAVAASLVVVAFWFGATERREAAALQQARAESGRQSRELARLNTALAFVTDPAVKEVTFGKGAPKPPQGKVFVDPAKGVLLMASNLRPAPPGKIYEMWLIPKKGNPQPAGLFQAERDESALHIRGGPVDLAATAAIAVTLEPAAGTQAPTSQPLIVAAL